MEHYIVHKDPKAYCSFPLIEHIDDTEIYVGFFKAPVVDHCGIYEWMVMLSQDGGATWEETNSKLTKLNWRSHKIGPRGISDRYIWGNNAVGSAGFKRMPSGKIGISPMIHLQTSKDKYIEPAGVRGIIIFPRFLHTSNGFIYIPAYGILKNGKSKCFVFRISDSSIFHDKWSLIPMFPDNINANEMAFMEISPGTILALVRSEDTDFMLESWSYDQGSTWTYPVKTNILGTPPHLLWLKDERILCSYGYRFDQMGIRAVVSEGGKQWTRPIVLRQDGGHASSLHKISLLNRWRFHRRNINIAEQDVGYPVSVQLEDESILTAYYITTGDRTTHVAATKWRI